MFSVYLAIITLVQAADELFYFWNASEYFLNSSDKSIRTHSDVYVWQLAVRLALTGKLLCSQASLDKDSIRQCQEMFLCCHPPRWCSFI